MPFSNSNLDTTSLINKRLRVGIIGGGVSGSTIALRLAALNIQTTLFEKKPSLIDGPPMCHLHAGGNLYREIPDEDCITLLKQSIDMLRLYPYSIDCRPTIITIPKRDKGNPSDLIPRLKLLTQVYQEMVNDDINNKVLGDPSEYYKLYSREEVESLVKRLVAAHYDPLNFEPKTTDDWVAAAAYQLDLDQLKYPLVTVMEYGWNIFRLAACAQRALSFHPNANVCLGTTVTQVKNILRDTEQYHDTNDHLDNNCNKKKAWEVTFSTTDKTTVDTYNDLKGELLAGQTDGELNRVCDADASTRTIEVDYLINACGFRSGVIDDMVGVNSRKMVEFKASYIAHWNVAQRQNGDGLSESNAINKVDQTHKSNTVKLPEIIIHGERGTPNGMVQLTPYPNGFFQIHSMNNQVTLFEDGLVKAPKHSANPKLKSEFIDYIDKGWDEHTLNHRNKQAIEQVSQFVPRFINANPTSKALYGGQQIPGYNDECRVADVSLYPGLHYARAESVKASSALSAADAIINQLVTENLIEINDEQYRFRKNHKWKYLKHTDKQNIDKLASKLAKLRDFPVAMADVVTPYYPIY